MLKFFFNRNSKMITLMETWGLLLTFGWFYRLIPTDQRLTKIGIGIYFLEYLFLKVCALFHWHKEAKRFEGIELHFKKGLIPTAYLMALTSTIGFLTGSEFLLWFSILLLGIIAHVNVILLYLHCKDKNKTPINYFSGNKFKT